MSQTTTNTNQEWLKVLGKGMVTIPKQWRQELGIEEGDIIKAKKEGKRLVIEPQQENFAPYRVYSDEEIDAFVKEDKLSSSLANKIQKNLAGKNPQ